MSEIPSFVYDEIKKYADEESMALALIHTREELEKANKKLEFVKQQIQKLDNNFTVEYENDEDPDEGADWKACAIDASITVRIILNQL